MFDPFRKLMGKETTVEKREREARERREQAQRAGVNPDAVSTLTGHTSRVNALVALPNGLLASGSGGIIGNDNTIKLWDVGFRALNLKEKSPRAAALPEVKVGKEASRREGGDLAGRLVQKESSL